MKNYSGIILMNQSTKKERRISKLVSNIDAEWSLYSWREESITVIMPLLIINFLDLRQQSFDGAYPACS